MRTEPPGTCSRLDIVAFGVRVGIEFTDSALAGLITRCLPAGWKRISPQALDRLYSITTTGTSPVQLTLAEFTGRDEVCVAGPGQGTAAISTDPRHSSHPKKARFHFESMKQFLEVFESDLHLYLAARARTRLFVHAGVVRWKHMGIVIPGRSFSGKSNLVMALMNAGATCYSDEYAVLDPSGRIHAFPRPIRLRANGSRVARRIHLTDQSPLCPLEKALLLFSKYEENASWNPKKISPGAALMHLLANTVAARACPQRALFVLSRVVERAVAFETLRGEAERTAEALLELCHTSFTA